MTLFYDLINFYGNMIKTKTLSFWCPVMMVCSKKLEDVHKKLTLGRKQDFWAQKGPFLGNRGSASLKVLNWGLGSHEDQTAEMVLIFPISLKYDISQIMDFEWWFRVKSGVKLTLLMMKECP